jgi:hypothetical protein
MDTQHTASAAVLEEGVIETITRYGGLDRGEVVVHFDLVASLRCVSPGDGLERIRRLHWAPRGSDPHLSYGVLHAQAVQIRNELT